MSNLIRYNFEYERKLKVCFIGAGGHSYRNIYPTFQGTLQQSLEIMKLFEAYQRTPDGGKAVLNPSRT